MSIINPHIVMKSIEKNSYIIGHNGLSNLIIFDWDGVWTSTERMSHFAAWEILKLSNPQMPDKMEMSDRLFGVKVIKQRAIMEEFFAEKGLEIVFPKNFDKKRDLKQLKMLKNVKLVEGMEKFSEWLSYLKLPSCIASRSREEPFLLKYKTTKVDSVISESCCFLPNNIDKNCTAWDLMEKRFAELNISEADREFDKVEIFSYAAASLNHKPEKCIVIEDSVKGVVSAIKSGMYPLCFLGAEDTNNAETRAALKDIIPDNQICEDAQQLLIAILKKVS